MMKEGHSGGSLSTLCCVALDGYCAECLAFVYDDNRPRSYISDIGGDKRPFSMKSIPDAYLDELLTVVGGICNPTSHAPFTYRNPFPIPEQRPNIIPDGGTGLARRKEAQQHPPDSALQHHLVQNEDIPS